MAAMFVPLLNEQQQEECIESPKDVWAEHRSKELSVCAAARHGGDKEASSSAVVDVVMRFLAGVLLWLITLALAVGFATFAFLSMPSETHLAISMQVLGTAVVFLWLGVLSKNPASCVQASPIPAIYVSMFARRCEESGLEGPAKVSTVLAFIWMTTLIQGVTFIICSRFHMGDVLQYFPHSVTTGYNGGIGLLILNASISMMSGVNPLEDLQGFLQRGPLLLALPGSLIALVVYPLSLRCTGPTFKVLPILATIAVFHSVLRCTNTSLEEARDAGWVFPYYGYSKPTDAMEAFDYSLVNWDLLQGSASLVPAMTLISMIAQYASLGAILLQVAETTKDADAETRHLGFATTVSALLGSMPNLSGMAPSAVLLSVLGNKGVRGACLVICGALHTLLFFSGFPLVSFLPKCSIAGCLLLPISFKMIRGALVDSLAVSTWGDYVVVWVMSWTTLLLNIQWGLGAGFILSAFRLLYEYAHHDVVDRRETLREAVTLKGRDIASMKILQDHGEEVAAFRLKGVLFFGNCVSLKLELNALLDDVVVKGGQPPKFVLVDFSEVVYVDSSVWEILANITQKAQKLSATEVFLSALSKELIKELMQQGQKVLSNLHVEFISQSYLCALEKLEDRILAFAGAECADVHGWDQFVAWVASGGIDEAGSGLKQRLQKYFTEGKYAQGDIVQRAGTAATVFNWIRSGEFHIFVKAPVVRSAHGATGWSPAFSAFIAPGKLPEPHSDVALLHGKLTAGFIAGLEVLCHEKTQASRATVCGRATGAKPMVTYTSIQCKRAGAVLQLTAEKLQALRKEDPELCVAFLLAVASQREAQLRQHMLHRVEPEEVEIVDGCRRRFTKLVDSTTVLHALGKFPSSPWESVGGVSHSVFKKLKGVVIDLQDRRPSDQTSELYLKHMTSANF